MARKLIGLYDASDPDFTSEKMAEDIVSKLDDVLVDDEASDVEVVEVVGVEDAE